MLQVTKVLQSLRYLACLTSHLWSVDDDANTGPPNAVITQPDRLFQSKKTAEKFIGSLTMDQDFAIGSTLVLICRHI